MEGHHFFDSHDPVFDLNGFWWLEENDGRYERLPISAYPHLREELCELSTHNSGGFLRFSTDSDSLCLEAELLGCHDMNHFPRVGVSGLDIYCDGRYLGSVSGSSQQFKISGALQLPGEGSREITVYFPLYNGLKRLAVGIRQGATLARPKPMRYEKPVVFYGSSITQGGCASRPGNCYTNLLSRWLDTKMINLGFSGNAKGDPRVAELIAEIDMSAFVMDYDHNSLAAELDNNHYPFYRTVREKHPKIPILMVSMANREFSAFSASQKYEIIYNTYHRAKAEGDDNVYFLFGEDFYREIGFDVGTVDRLHPNDLGFYHMAKGIQELLGELLERGEKR